METTETQALGITGLSLRVPATEGGCLPQGMGPILPPPPLRQSPGSLGETQ